MSDADFQSTFLRTLSARGYIHQVTHPAELDAASKAGVVTGYIGFDATASREPAWATARHVTDALVRALPGELDALCLSSIARFKRPKHYMFIEALPKNNYGKILKTELRARDGKRPLAPAADRD